MPISQAMATSFKSGALSGTFNFATGTPQTYRIALYTNAANLDATTTAYTATGEVSGTGYTARGAVATISQNATTTGTTGHVNFANVSWSGATFTARGALLYLDNGSTNPAVAVLDFGSDRTATGGTFTVNMPVTGASTSLIRLA